MNILYIQSLTHWYTWTPAWEHQGSTWQKGFKGTTQTQPLHEEACKMHVKVEPKHKESKTRQGMSRKDWETNEWPIDGNAMKLPGCGSCRLNPNGDFVAVVGSFQMQSMQVVADWGTKFKICGHVVNKPELMRLGTPSSFMSTHTLCHAAGKTLW